MLTKPRLVIGIVVLALLVYAALAFDVPYRDKVDDFVTCAAMGNPVMESYPRQCRDKKGNLYVEVIATTTTSDLIRITSPLSGTLVSSPVSIKGEARGTWFFEASFPITILAKDGTVLKESFAQAEGEWMTESFVPFSTSITFDAKGNTEGIIRFKKDNPSGDPERDQSVDIPVLFGTTTTGTTTTKACVITGCSSQICSDEDMATTCEYREEYACYKTATCKRQADGKCGWTQTAELSSCLMNS